MSDESTEQGEKHMSSVEKMTSMGEVVSSPGPGEEHFKKFRIGDEIPQPVSQTEVPDIRMQISPDAGQDKKEPSDAEKRAEYEIAIGHRRPEYTEFHEQLREQDVRHYKNKIRDVWLGRWFEMGGFPNNYLVENVTTSARGRIDQLLDSMPNGNHKYTNEETQAGLAPGTFWSMPSDDLVLDERTTVEEVERDSGKKERVWVFDGEEVGLFKTNEKVATWMGLGPNMFRANIYIGRRVTEKQAEKKRKEIAGSIESSLPQVEAWANILSKVQEQDTFAGNEKTYLVDRFLRYGKVIARSKYYAEILDAEPTREGFAKFGEKVQTGREALREMREGRALAEVGFKDPTPENPDNIRKETLIIPNHFAYSQNQGLRELALKYIVSRIEEENPSKITEMTEALKYAEGKDNRAAAIVDLVLADHWDEDAEAAFDTVWGIDDKTKHPVIKDVLFEVAYVDSAKMIWPTPRREKEYFGYMTRQGLTPQQKHDKRREHPRRAGAPTTIEFLPKLSSHFTEVTKIGVLAVRKNSYEAAKIKYDEAIARDEEAKDPWEVAKKEIRTVTIDQRAYGTRDTNGDRYTFKHGNKKYTEIRQAKKSNEVTDEDRWIFEVTGLGDRNIWDTIQVVLGDKAENLAAYSFDDIKEMVPVSDARGDKNAELKKKTKEGKYKHMELAQGTNTNATEITKGLFEYYAHESIYVQYTRTDFIDMNKELTEPNFKTLRKISKMLEVAPSLLATQYQLSEDTVKALGEFLRIGLVAGNVASIVAWDKNLALMEADRARQPQTRSEGAVVAKGTIELTEQAMLASGFVRNTTDKHGAVEWRNPKDKKLYYAIIKNRDKAPLTPFSFGYFTPEQKKELEKLYSFLKQG